MGFFNVFSGEKKRKEIGVSGKRVRSVKSEKTEKKTEKEAKKVKKTNVEGEIVAKAKTAKTAKPQKSKEKAEEKIASKEKSLGPIRPYVAEKATMLGENNVYVFEVDRNINKIAVRQFIKKTYKTDPIKVNIINLPAKKVFMRGKWGKKSGKKKAMVYLKEGEKISI